jgi:hypothetical protein
MNVINIELGEKIDFVAWFYFTIFSQYEIGK